MPKVSSATSARFHTSELGTGTGTAANFLRGDGIWSTPPHLIKVTEVFQGTLSYSPSAGVRALFVEAIGGGGAGGGGDSVAASASCGAGGGGGAYSAVFLTGTIKTTYTVAVGAGGTAGAAGANAGNAGGDTTFDTGPSVCTAKGGSGGASGGAAGTTALLTAGAAGGVAASGIGDMKCDGNAGGLSNRLSGTAGASGRGGDGPWGGGAVEVVAQATGTTGGLYGGGGAGGASLNGGAAVAGGPGGNGLLRIWEYA